LGLDTDQIDGVHFGSLIHDVGKISIPAEILSKPRKLSDIEFMLIKTHPQAGYNILKGLDFPWPVAK
jgi:HD-GYP domain-containing protein (c-di-GMP phosphodiesterase class II)